MGFLAFADFLGAFVDLALVLRLDFVLVFAFFGDAFFATGFLAAFVEPAVAALAVEAFFRGAVVVRPVWAFGLDTALVA